MAPKEEEGDRTLVAGRPDEEQCDNKVTTSKYTVISFIPVVSDELWRKGHLVTRSMWLVRR